LHVNPPEISKRDRAEVSSSDNSKRAAPSLPERRIPDERDGLRAYNVPYLIEIRIFAI
jgi:hypothetical protein